MHTCVHLHMQAPAHLHTHTYTHTPIYTHSHTHACIIRIHCDKCYKPISTRWNLKLFCQRAHSHSASMRTVIDYSPDPRNWLPPEGLYEGLDGLRCETSGLLVVAISWLQRPCPVCKRHPVLSSSQTPAASERHPRLKNRNPALVSAAPRVALSRRGRCRYPLPGSDPVAASWNPFPAHLFREPPQAVWHELRR